MLPDQFQQLLEKFSRGTCTPEEEQLINEWYQNIDAREKAFLPHGEKDLIEEKLWSTINPRPTSPKRHWLLSAAVLVPVLVTIALYFTHQGSTRSHPGQDKVASSLETKRYQNKGSGPLNISLADGSTVSLQPMSQLTLGENFGATSREVHLVGEGFFIVSRDEARPFMVYANEVVTRVLGTSFNVRAYEDDKEVTVAVKSGKVSVFANKNRSSVTVTESPEVILTPNQQMVYHRVREVISKQLVEKPEIVLPESDLFTMQFENEEVSRILDVLQRNYGVEIRFDRDVLDNCKLTTSMSDEGLYERIAVICKAIGASYSIDDQAVITIKSNGC